MKTTTTSGSKEKMNHSRLINFDGTNVIPFDISRQYEQLTKIQSDIKE